MLFNVYLISLVDKRTGHTKTLPITAPDHSKALAQAWSESRIKEADRQRWQAKVTQVSSFRLPV